MTTYVKLATAPLPNDAPSVQVTDPVALAAGVAVVQPVGQVSILNVVFGGVC
jgi:hypothetical protein